MLTAMARSQNTHRHPISWVMKPPATGPITGPNNGPRDQIAMNFPRFSWTIKSDMVPAPMVNGQLPKTPARKRMTSKVAMFWDSAHPTLKATNPMLQLWYSGVRP